MCSLFAVNNFQKRLFSRQQIFLNMSTCLVSCACEIDHILSSLNLHLFYIQLKSIIYSMMRLRQRKHISFFYSYLFSFCSLLVTIKSTYLSFSFVALAAFKVVEVCASVELALSPELSERCTSIWMRFSVRHSTSYWEKANYPPFLMKAEFCVKFLRKL